MQHDNEFCTLVNSGHLLYIKLILMKAPIVTPFN